MNTFIEGYILGTKYCRKNRKCGGVTIFVHETLTYLNNDLALFCNDHDFEVCAENYRFPLPKLLFYVFIDHHLEMLNTF